jgi:cathepsin L
MFFNYFGNLHNLSEQNLVDCDFYSFGCSSGSAYYAFMYVHDSQNGYFSTEEDYPYTGDVGSCKFVKGPARLLDYDWFSDDTEQNLLSSVYLYGPIACVVDASHPSFQLYTSGIYNEPACSKTNVNHAVTTVG